MMTELIDRYGIPICVFSISLITPMNKTPEANMRLRFAKGMRLEMTMFLALFSVAPFLTDGAVLLFLVLAIISDKIMKAVVKYARIENGKAPSNFFSDPM